ncbi:MAG: carbamoyltransferase C-terminal domain-containing protein [Vicinamibacteria bacterium]
MLIVGLSAFGQNPGACILRDGKLIAFAEEERFVRIKGANLRFPAKALAYCLREAKATLDDVDRFAVGWNAEKYRVQMPLFFARQFFRNIGAASDGSSTRILAEIADQKPDAIRRRTVLALREEGLSGRVPEFVFVDHHLAHAASAFYASGFEDASVLVVDGSGEDRSTSFYAGKGLDIADRGSVELPDSLGWFYAAVTSFLGFRAYEEEGFTMGLAPYGNASPEWREKMERLVRFEANGLYRVDPRYTLLGRHSTNEHFSDELTTLLGPPRLPKDPLTQTHKDIAAAAQERLEQAVLRLVKKLVDHTGSKKLCVAGGVAMNCKMNGVIGASGLVDGLFVQPAAHDSGTALGAAMWVSARSGEDPRFRMEHAQWGPGYSSAEVEKAARTAGMHFERPDSIEEKTAEALASGKVVAWFKGRMEVGPRALGGRSILAHPALPGMNDRVNRDVKFRDAWRPFCPSMLDTAAADYLKPSLETRFMTVAAEASERGRKEIPAVIHVDGSTRPQTVNVSTHPSYAKAITAFGKRTGLPVVLNTSLNVKGEPVACTPMDALRCFYSSGIDAIALEDIWLSKD